MQDKTVTIENGKLIFIDRANPNSTRHIEMFYENGDFKTIEVKTTRQETTLTNIEAE